jgi:hypothetical protein
MDKATAEAPPAEAGPSEWRYRTILGRLKSGMTLLYTQYQAIGRDKDLICWMESGKLLIKSFILCGRIKPPLN